MENNRIETLEKRVAHLEATLEKIFKACYYQEDALNCNATVWHFLKKTKCGK